MSSGVRRRVLVLAVVLAGCGGPAPERVPLDEKTRESLRALGYIR
jgi:hypothetical protein